MGTAIGGCSVSTVNSSTGIEQQYFQRLCGGKVYSINCGSAFQAGVFG